MALQVWLPLNGNLNNQGLADVTITNNGAVVNDSGKIGKCYYFNGTNAWIKISLPSNMKTLKNTSITMFVKGNRSFGGISHDGGANLATATFYTSWQFANGSAWKYWSGGSATDGNWHHIALTSDNDNFYTYIDGGLVTSFSISGNSLLTDLTSSHFIELGCDHPGGDEYGTDYINDFRIYDNCLSPREVRELSKGLVLHYPLNQEENSNLIKSSSISYVSPNWSSWYTPAANTENSCLAGFSGLTFPSGTAVGDTFTFSFDFEWTKYTVTSGKTLRPTYIQWYANGSWSTGISTPLAHTTCATTSELTSGPGVKTIVITGTITSEAQITANWYANFRTDYSDGTGKFRIKNFKLERGSKKTAWSPNAADALYSTLGYNSTIIDDASGFEYNGTKSGTISWSGDTPRYNASSRFNKSYITAPIPNTLKPSDAITLSCWFKLDSQISSGELCLFTCYEGGGAGLNINNGMCGMAIYSSGYKNAYVSFSDMTNWHHLAGTFDGQYIKSYIDGELVATTSTTAGSVITYNSTTPWELGGNPGPSGGASDSKMVGQISDARIYATALSAADIKELYNAPISITNSGTLMIQGEVVE